MNIKNRYIFNQMAVAKGWLIKTFLLLLLLFVACGEPDDMFGTIHGDDEEIELTINTLLPDGGISTRTAPAENITSITALAFDRNHELIKVQTSEVVQTTTSNTTGTFKVTVPQRTRRIHFIAKNNGEFTEITESDYGKTDVGLLVNRISSIQNSQDADGISNALHYWQMLDFESAEDLKDLSDELQALDKKTDDGYQLPLIRNMAKITLNLQNGMTGHIAGILNYNTTGTIVPYLKDGNNYTFGYQTKTNHELPSTFVITSDVSNCSELGTVHYLFEEYDDVGDLIYVMCYIDNDGESGNEAGHFYKVALVKSEFTGVEDKYYYVIRNQAYNIKIVDKLDVTLGKTDYSDAVQNGKPINDSQKEQVHLDIEPDELNMYIGETGKVIVKIPAGINQFQIGYLIDKFDEGGVFIEDITPTNSEVSADGSIYIDTYDVAELGTEFELSVKLKESITDAISGMEIQFKGTGEAKRVDDKLIVNVLKKGVLNVTPTALDIPKTKGSNFSVKVFIPSYDNYDGAYELKVTDEDKKYNITAPGELVLNQNGTYNVEKGQTYTFFFELREEGQVGEEHTIQFYLDTDFNDDSGTTTVTLIDNVVHDQDYEIWVDDSDWTGTENSVTFFGYKSSTDNNGFEAGSKPDDLRTNFYDGDANAHITESMVMGSDDSFTFTIPEGENRYLTMLVAANGGNPNINLTGSLADGSSWATEFSGASIVPTNYNFGNGEIGSAGRLIRYELAPGTYTLKGSDATYLLYYMRLTRTKPEMTDVAQPLLTDYTLSWSGATYTNKDATGHLPIGEDNKKHIVDENNLTHTVSLKADNSLKTSLNLYNTLSTFDLTVATKRVTFTNTNENSYNDSKSVTNDYNNQTNSCSLNTHNAGNYTLKGTINSPEYKYSAFYDKLLLDAVQYEVKSPIMPGLYTSMDGDKLTPVNGFTSLDEAWAIGFKMPMVVPAPASDLLSNDYTYTIGINIPNWTLSTDGDARGLGVIDNGSGNYTLGTQKDNNNNEMIHPREGWTYKIKWASIAGDEIVPSLTGDKYSDTDHYFIYDGTIAKSVVIPTPLEIIESSLNISLDFYALDANSQKVDRDDERYTDLQLGTSRFVLEVTIDGADAQAYNGQTVYLAGDFETIAEGAGQNGWAIHWVNSKKEGAISYYGNDNNGSGLQFKIDGTTSYKIEWVFKTGGNYNGGEIGFDYKISAHSDSPTKYNLSGDTQATIAFTNESQIQVATNGNQASNNINLSLEYGENSAEEFTVDVPVPNNVSGINISAPNYLAVSIGKLAAAGEQYPEAAVAVNGNYKFTDSDNTTAPRFKFKLNGTPTENPSVITFTSADGNASKATVTVNWTQRGAESNQTTIWSGAMDLQWTQNYLETTTNQLPAGTQVTLNFTTINGQNGQIKLHDSGGNQIASENIQGITYDSNNGVSVGNAATQLTFTLQNAVNGLKINGNNVRMTSIVVSTSGSSPTETVYSVDFTNVGSWNLWCQGDENHPRNPSVDSTNGFCLSNPEIVNAEQSWLPQYHLANGLTLETGTYRITMYIRGSREGQIDRVGLGSWDTGQTYSNSPMTFTTEWQEKTVEVTLPTATGDGEGFVMCQSGSYVGDLYIKWLRVEKITNN